MSKTFVEEEIAAIKAKLRLYEVNRIISQKNSNYGTLKDEDSKLLFWKTYLKLKNKHFRTIFILVITIMTLIVINKFNFGKDSFFQCVLCIGVPLYILLSLSLSWIIAWILWWPVFTATKIINLHLSNNDQCTEPTCKSFICYVVVSFLELIGVKSKKISTRKNSIAAVLQKLIISLGGKLSVTIEVKSDKINDKNIVHATIAEKKERSEGDSKKDATVYELDCCFLVIVIISTDSEIESLSELISELKATKITDKTQKEKIIAAQ